MKPFRRSINEFFPLSLRDRVRGTIKFTAPSPLPSHFRDCVATYGHPVVIPNECEGSKISPFGRNDREVNRDDVFRIATQSLKGKQVFRALLYLSAFFTLVLFFLSTPGIGYAQPREKIRVALGSISVNTSVIPVGHQYGIFAKHEKEKGTF